MVIAAPRHGFWVRRSAYPEQRFRAASGFAIWASLTMRASRFPPNFLGEQNTNMLASFAMARRPDREKVDVLSQKDLQELRHNLAHPSLGAVRDFYEQAYRDCRLIYSRLPSPRQMQTLVQVWKQLRKWR